MITQQMILKAGQYKGSSQRSRYVVSQFKNDAIPMMIFSYLWTSNAASKRIRELNSKSMEVVKSNLMIEFPGLFIDIEQSVPQPLRDIFFNDYQDFNFQEYKDVHVHEIDFYHNGEFLNGLEIYYLVDGDIMKYALHHRVQKITALAQKDKKPINPLGMLFKKRDETEEEEREVVKKSLYFNRNEYIRRVKISGQAYLHYLELETNEGKIYRIGKRKTVDHDCEFEVGDGYKIISFAGVMQAFLTECRILNLAITSKQLYEDCNQYFNLRALSPFYREVIQLRYELFNPVRTEYWEQIKRIKAIKLFPGKMIGKEKESNPKYFVLGGLKVIYELKSGEEYENGIEGLKCQNYEMDPIVLELRDNEYITSINGMGKEYVQEINMETNFYRKIKQGAKIKGKAAGEEQKQQTGIATLVNPTSTNPIFSMGLPPGAKVLAFAGSADEYIRSIFVYYKV